MPTIESALLHTGQLDALAGQDTAIHRIDPRAKLIVTLSFVIAVVSFDKYEVSALLPFLLYPVVLMSVGKLPPGFLLTKVAIVAPFAVLIGVFNPLFDKEPAYALGNIVISGGWISFASILIRFLLTVSAALTLIATTGFNSVCFAMQQLKVPRIFVVQLLLLYRYLFVLSHEAIRMLRALYLRSTDKNRVPFSVYASLVGQLLLRALRRANRIYTAMLCRGFSNEIHITTSSKFRVPDALFMLLWGSFFIVARRFNLPTLLGQTVMELFQ